MRGNTKYIFVTGGVMSGLGKGVSAASIGKIMQFRGFDVDAIKIDPYLNVDPGTLNPVEHGEVFITDNVWEFRPVEDMMLRISEIDQDFGTYERFLGKSIDPSHNITSGQVYLTVIMRERRGDFLGKTVQIIPHVTDEIKSRLRKVVEEDKPDLLITEVGGTVGDIESSPYLEAIRQIRLEEKRENVVLVHVTLVPYLETVGQLKSKPTQHSVRLLQQAGLQPDVILGRAVVPLTTDVKRKISLFCNVQPEAVISNPNLEVVYELPILFEKEGLGDHLCKILDLPKRRVDSSHWANVVNLYKNVTREVSIAMPGKYVAIPDSYVSINEALRHAGAASSATAKINWIDTELIEKEPEKRKDLLKYDGILATPGFGGRGVEGMILTAQTALEFGMPYLGICYGAQMLFIAFCRTVLGLKNANTTEVEPETPFPVVDFLPEQKLIDSKGGTMRLGGHVVKIKKGTKLYSAYGKDAVVERFRHRYHLISDYMQQAEKAGLVVSAYDETGKIINAIEIGGNAWILGVQFHPEFTSRPDNPNPLYSAFIRAAIEWRDGGKKTNPLKLAEVGSRQ
ncbi:MAG: CTP synthase [Promethearchaeati archaeon SRVP18_Atabeyarchaeia-1]